MYNVLSADAPVGAPPEGNAKEVTRRRCRVTTTVSSNDEIMATGSLPAALSLPAAICSGCANLMPPCATALLDLRCTWRFASLLTTLLVYFSCQDCTLTIQPMIVTRNTLDACHQSQPHWRSQAGAARCGELALDQPHGPTAYCEQNSRSQKQNDNVLPQRVHLRRLIHAPRTPHALGSTPGYEHGQLREPAVYSHLVTLPIGLTNPFRSSLV